MGVWADGIRIGLYCNMQQNNQVAIYAPVPREKDTHRSTYKQHSLIYNFN